MRGRNLFLQSVVDGVRPKGIFCPVHERKSMKMN